MSLFRRAVSSSGAPGAVLGPVSSSVFISELEKGVCMKPASLRMVQHLVSCHIMDQCDELRDSQTERAEGGRWATT